MLKKLGVMAMIALGWSAIALTGWGMSKVLCSHNICTAQYDASDLPQGAGDGWFP